MRAFVEINRTQKRISTDHIDEIAYPVLGDDYPRALAAQVILRANQRSNSSLGGLFRSGQTTEGIYRAATVIAHLSGITNLRTIRTLNDGQPGDSATRRQGYENLFGIQVEELVEPSALIERGVVCLQRYFGCVARVFDEDWPRRGETRPSTISYTKVFSAFVRLLAQFIREGLQWHEVEAELKMIRGNILACRGLDAAQRSVVLAKSDSAVPDDQPSVTDTFRYLNANRSSPTSISEVRQRT